VNIDYLLDDKLILPIISQILRLMDRMCLETSLVSFHILILELYVPSAGVVGVASRYEKVA
jgi:hypothetical protein